MNCNGESFLNDFIQIMELFTLQGDVILIMKLSIIMIIIFRA